MPGQERLRIERLCHRGQVMPTVGMVNRDVTANPMHVAASKYDKDELNSAPVVVAKGCDAMAQRTG
ncbi:MAG: EscU/YscU/HrcU family type III secretion system export apparatus switch protein [Planctomycetes bacterium]|nr:EscU/YscU/HrcU family type III secretion system export apparatus switch protein [Planctomycetota bacterium]